MRTRLKFLQIRSQLSIVRWKISVETGTNYSLSGSCPFRPHVYPDQCYLDQESNTISQKNTWPSFPERLFLTVHKILLELLMTSKMRSPTGNLSPVGSTDLRLSRLVPFILFSTLTNSKMKIVFHSQKSRKFACLDSR